MGYRDILRGPQLKTDYDRYIIWLQKSTQEKQTLYRSSREGTRFEYEKRVLWVAPFGQNAKTLFVQVKGPVSGVAIPAPTLLGLLATYFSDTAPTGANDVILERSQFPINKLARMLVKKRVTTATAETASRITGREYKHHTTNAISMPFGKNVVGDEYAGVIKNIKQVPAYKSFINVKGDSISFVPEG